MGEREAFEWWAIDQGLFIEIDDAVRGDGRSYKFRETHTAWAAWQARASSPAPALGLTAEDREQIRQARVRDPQVHREALSIHERDRRNLLAIIDRCFPRLTTPADGEGGR